MMTLFDKQGGSKLVPELSYPATGLGCVSRVYTDHGTFAVGPQGVSVVDLHGLTQRELVERTGLSFG